jgi:lysophospholipid acyltransferase (LPLAT)-like uncharacterized protein
VVKPGIVAAAQHTGAAIIPVGTAASHAWRARSWDAFLVPRPFARVRVVYGPPLQAAPGRSERDRLVADLAQALDAATAEAESLL